MNSNSVEILSACLGLLLLCLFIQLTVNRVPNRHREAVTLRSIATHFRKEERKTSQHTEFFKTVKNDGGKVILEEPLKNFFLENGEISDAAKAALSERISNKVSFEINCKSSLPAITKENFYKTLLEGENRCLQIKRFLLGEGVSPFLVTAKSELNQGEKTETLSMSIVDLKERVQWK